MTFPIDGYIAEFEARKNVDGKIETWTGELEIVAIKDGVAQILDKNGCLKPANAVPGFKRVRKS